MPEAEAVGRKESTTKDTEDTKKTGRNPFSSSFVLSVSSVVKKL